MTAWRKQAACRDEEPELFFPIGDGAKFQQQIEDAKWVCSLCPVRSECLEFAIEHKSLGIYGGMDEEDRRKLIRRRSRQRASA